MDIKSLKKILRRGIKNKTIYIIFSHVSSHDKVRDGKYTIVIGTILHVFKEWVVLSLLASEQNICTTLGDKEDKIYYGVLYYEDFLNFREWKPDDAPLTLHFNFISDRYKKISFEE